MDRTYFQEDWLQNPDFKNWVRRDVDRKKAFCIQCHKSTELSNMGTQALKSHTSGKKHKERAKPVTLFFKPSVTNTSNSNAQSNNPKINTNPPPHTHTTGQLTLDQSVTSPHKCKAELRWAIKSVMSNFSNSSCSDVNSLFEIMFPDSNIAICWVRTRLDTSSTMESPLTSRNCLKKKSKNLFAVSSPLMKAWIAKLRNVS